MTFKYVQKELTPRQQKELAKRQAKLDAQAVMKKEAEERAAKEKQEKLYQEYAAREKEAQAEREKRAVREKARQEKPASFPKDFNDEQAKMLIRGADFSKPDYVETGLSKGGTMTRRAFVHYRGHIEFDEDDVSYYECWIGANAHPDDKELDGWAPGNSYILEYPGFSMPTSLANVKIIKGLPDSYGVKPDVL